MTKIKNYPLDLEVNGGDKWIGTDSASLAKLTKNFTPDNLAKYYNDKEVVESVNQMRFFYDTVEPGDSRASGSFSFATEVGPIVPFSSIDSLVFSKYTMGNDAVNNFMTDILNSIIIIQKANNPDIYGFYALNAYEVDPINPDFYNVGITYSLGTGSIEEDEDYLVSLIQFAGAAGIQTILGSDFIDSSLTGIGEVTISLSATGTPSNLTGLRGDNTWGTLGLESLDEGGRKGFGSENPAIGWRLIGRDPSIYGNIGQGSIDFSSGYFADVSLPFGGSIINSPQIGSTGPGSFTLGGTVENNSNGGVVFGTSNVLNGGPNIEPTYFSGGVILGSQNQSYGLNYYNLTSGYKNLIGDRTQQSWSAAGFPYPYPVQYWSGQIGMYNQMPAGFASAQLGYGLLSSAPGSITVGVANEDVTLSIAENVTNNRNALNPRFTVGCGTFSGDSANPSVGIRQNGFVVMSDGTASFPVLSNTMIDSAGSDSAVTKGWVQAQTDINTTYDLASAQNGADVDVALTGSDATSDIVKLVAGSNIILTDNGANAVTIDAIGAAISSEKVQVEVKNTSGVTLTKGTPVYITGTVGATDVIEVAAADASDSAKMPSVGLLDRDIINNDFGFAITGGFLNNVTTDPIDGLTPVENDTVYVKPGGGLTLTKPINGNFIQNIAKVGKVSGGNSGSLIVSSILRTNDVPNLTTGKIWVGTAANTAESTVVHLDEGNGRMGVGTTSPIYALDVVGNLNNIARLTSTTTASQLLFVDSGTTDAVAIGSSGDDLNIRVDNGYIDLKTNSGASALTRMRITPSGNVGIGTTSPSEKLHISSGYALVENTGIGSSVIVNRTDGMALNLKAGSGASQFTFDNSGFFAISSDTKTNVLSGAGSGNQVFVVTGAGNVGIGTTSPDYKLDVAGDVRIESASALNFGGTAAASSTWQLQTANAQADFQIGETNTGPRMYFEAGGDIGIGTTAPAQKLHVSGNIRVGTTSDNVFANKFTALGNADVELRANAGHNVLINSTSGDDVGIGTSAPAAKLDVNGGIRMADDASAASATNVGTLRYRSDANNSYVDMCMQTGASTYEWINIVQNNW